MAAEMGSDLRVGSKLLNVGIVWGGSCCPKDALALRAIASDHEYDANMLRATISINECQRRRVIGKLQQHLHTLKDKRIAMLRLSFKPDTDDLR